MPAKNSPKPPTQREQISELREQMAALMAAMQGLTGPAVPSRAEPSQAAEEITAEDAGNRRVQESPRTSVPSAVQENSTEARSHGDPVLRFLWAVVLIGFPLAIFAVGAWHKLGPASDKLPAHVAVVAYAHLLSTEVCDEVLAEIEKSDEIIPAERVAAIIKERGEEARSAAWEPVLRSLNDLQDEDGGIPTAKARKAVEEIRKGLEAVR